MNIDLGMLILRLGFGGLFLSHGAGKLAKFSQISASFPDPLHVGSMFSLSLTVFAEVVCSVLIMLGLATRLAAIPPAITMLVAAAVIHAADPWPKKEFPLLYLIAFIVIGVAGPGRFSLDHLRRRR